MPLTLRLVLATLLFLVGLILVVVAVLGARARLRRNRWIGVRTPHTLASEAQFVAGNRAAALPVGAAGAVALVGGLLLAAAGVAVALDGKAWFGWTVLSILGGAVLVSWVIQAVRGHRGLCLVRRGLWFGLAAPGAPLRVVFNSP